MYAVIFRATLGERDGDYDRMGARMRELAAQKYGCTGISVCLEGNEEIAISYWPSLDQLKAWRQDPEHLEAQARGKAGWYLAYSVEVVEILRSYDFSR